MKAQAFATDKHSSQFRRDGSPYINHPKAVAKGVRKYKGDSKNIKDIEAAAYLHDTLEDTDTTYEELLDMFGKVTADMVMELTSDKEEIKKIGKTSYLQRKMQRMSSYALVIKLVDRLHNLSDLKTAQDPKWAIKYALQSYDILNYLQGKRELSKTHLAIIKDIQETLLEFMAGVLEDNLH